jgi:hypothetical protein
MLKGITHLPRPFRPMPVKQGWVLRQTDGVVREWRKKYCVLGRGQLVYYPSVQVQCDDSGIAMSVL